MAAQTSGLLIFGRAQGATDGEGAVQQVTEGGAGLETAEIR